MNAILKFLQAARNLKKAGITKEQVLDFARREFGKVEGLLKKQIDDIFKKPDTGTKQQGTKGDVVPIRDKNNLTKDDPMGDLEKIVKGEGNVGLPKKGIMATDEAEAMSPLDTSENVADAMRKLESKKMMDMNLSESAIMRSAVREFLSRQLKKGKLDIPDAGEKDTILGVRSDNDPIDIFRKAYGEDALIAVTDIFEQFPDQLRGSTFKEVGDSFEKLYKFNRGFDYNELPVPKKNYGYDEGLQTDEELMEMLRKDYKEKKTLEDFDPTDRKKNSDGGLINILKL